MTIEATAGELRKTGVSVIGDLRWGTHFCCFYETKQDLLDTLVPYFKAGLENKELCLWVVSPPLTVKEAKRALGQAVSDLDRHLAEGGLEIHRHDEWYLHNGQSDPQRVLQAWREKLNQALASGHAGLRASGDGGWVPKDDWMVFREYEKELDALIADQRRLILCTYSLTTSSGAQIFDAASLHQVAVARRHGSWEMVETPELKQAKAEIKRLNDELEQKVEERTRELATTNEALRAEIAERRLAEEAVKQAEDRIRFVIDTIPTMAWSLGPDGVLDFVNQRWLDYAGLSFEDAIKEPTGTMHPEDLSRVMERWRKDKAAGEPSEDEMRLRRVDGGYRWFLIRTVPLRDEQGNIIKWYGVSTDIEDRKQAEEQLERYAHVLQTFSRRLFEVQEEERRHLARELHDEIGQTLTAAKLNLKMIAPDVPRAVAGRLEDSIQLLDRLLMQVRQLSLDLRPPLLDDLGLVPALRWLVDQQAQRARLRVTFTASVEGLEIDPAVQTACFRVAQEAITNTIRHASAKSVAVELRGEADRLWLSVRDDGAGFDPAAIQQGATQYSSLGLVSMKERALLVHGGLEVRSAPRQGAEIRAWFPLAFREQRSATEAA